MLTFGHKSLDIVVCEVGKVHRLHHAGCSLFSCDGRNDDDDDDDDDPQKEKGVEEEG